MDGPRLPGADASAVSLRHLEGFLEVARTLHFRRAAENLYRTQPSLSRQIRSLEGRLGVVLFERHTRSVRLTPEGERLVPWCEALVAEVAAGIEQAREADRELRLVHLHHCAEASAQATRIGGLLRERRPGAEVQQHEVTARELGHHGADRAQEIRISAGVPDALGVMISTDPVVAVVPETSPLARPGALGLPALVAAAPCALGPEDAPGLRAALDRVGVPAEAVENGAELHALAAGRVVVDLSSRWGTTPAQLVRRAVPDVGEVTFTATTSGPALESVLRDLECPTGTHPDR